MNNLKEPLEYWGEWYLPEREDEKFWGVLRLPQEGYPILKLVNLPSDFRLPPRKQDSSPKIFGTTIDGKKISLHKCNLEESTTYNMTKKQLLTVIPSLIFISNDQNDKPIISEQFKMESFDIEYNIFYSWLWSSLNRQDNTLRYGTRPIESNEINIGGNKYTVEFVINISERADLKEIQTKRNACLRIKSKKGNITFEEVLQFNKYFQTFLSFSTAEKIYIKKLTGSSSASINIPKNFRYKFRKNVIKIPSFINCIIYQGDLRDLKDELTWDQMLFNHKNLMEQHLSFKESFEKWVKLYDKLSFYQSMFDSLYGNQLDTLSYFILLIPRIEQYYINKHNKNKIEEILDKLISENEEIIKKACVLEDDDFSKVIAYKNTGKKNNCENENRKQKKLSRFAEDCKNLRHFYVHTNKCYEDKIPQDIFEQALKAEKLKLFFDMLVLRELGFKDQNFIINAVKKARKKTLLP